jgi:hypothetical protein
MQDFKFESIERMKEATLRIQRILENRSNMINNNTYNIQEDHILITRINELLLESYEDLQKFPAEVSQFAREHFEENWQTYEANSKTICDRSIELLEINNELSKKINSMNKINKRLSLLCGFLVGLLISSVITIIMVLKYL